MLRQNYLQTLGTLLLCGCATFCSADEKSVLKYYPVAGEKNNYSIPVNAQNQNTDYTIVDYVGKVIFKGNAPIVDGKISIDLSLPEGYYELSTSNDQNVCRGFYVAPLTAVEKDDYFCLDAALSWLYQGERKNQREDLIWAMKHNNIAAARERFSWTHLAKKDGEFDFNQDSNLEYDAVRKMYKNAEVEVLDMCTHMTPLYDDKRVYPDLNGFVLEFDKLSERWADNWVGWETWNEPDLNSPPDYYVPAAKAQAFAARKYPNLPVAGVVSCVAYPESFHDYVAKNDLLKHMSTVSYHSYGEGLGVEASVGSFRKFTNEAGYPGMPLWITESNRPYRQDASEMERNTEMRLSAMNMVITAIEGKACGLERFFGFVFAAYREGPFGFGMVNADGSPLHIAAAYFTASRLLGGFDYVGDLNNVKGDDLKRARVFKNSKGQSVTVLVSGICDRKVKLSFPWEGKIYDIDGRLIAEGNGDDIEFQSGVVFYVSDFDQVKAHVNASTRAMKLLKESQVPPTKVNHNELTGLIIQPQVNKDEIFNRSKWGYIYDVPEMAEVTKLPFELFNLSENNYDVVLNWTIKDPKNNEVLASGNEPEAKISAKSSFKYEISFALRKLLEKHSIVDLTLSAVDKNGKELDHAVVGYQRYEYETYTALKENSPFKLFSSQNYWRNMGSLWQWDEDLKCEFKVTWSESLLTIDVNAVDNIHFQGETGAKIWMGDSYQIVLRQLRKEYNDKLEVAVALTNDGQKECFVYDQPHGVEPATAKGAVKGFVVREGDNMTYKLEITPAAVGLAKFESGQEFGFSMIMADNDGFGRKGCMAWGDGMAIFHGVTKTYNHLLLK